MLVIIGADAYGEKGVLAIMDGFLENADSWRDLLRSLRKRVLTQAPELAIGDGALGFWDGLAGCLSYHARAAVLGPQDSQRHGCDAEIAAGEGQS